MKKIISIIISLFLVLALGSTCLYAKSSNKIESLKIDDDVVHFARESISYHFFSASQDLNAFGFENEDLSSYKLGDGFSVYNFENDKISYMFALFSDNNIVGIFDVYYDNGSLHASLSTSCAKEIDALLKGNGSTYKIITDGINIYAVSSENQMNVIREKYKDNNQEVDIRYNEVYADDILIQYTFESLQNNLVLVYNPLVRGNVNQPISYKTLGVKSVLQGDNQCWAATAAMNINYLKGTTLTAYNVAYRIYPSNPYQGATNTTTVYAYSLWNVNASAQNRLSFSSIKSKINSSKPIHLILSSMLAGSHAVSLIGYEDWSDRDILILIDPDGGIRTTVELNSSGNFSYRGYTWRDSIVLS